MKINRDDYKDVDCVDFVIFSGGLFDGQELVTLKTSLQITCPVAWDENEEHPEGLPYKSIVYERTHEKINDLVVFKIKT